MINIIIRMIVNRWQKVSGKAEKSTGQTESKKDPEVQPKTKIPLKIPPQTNLESHPKEYAEGLRLVRHDLFWQIPPLRANSD